jgi:hypothetical protein
MAGYFGVFEGITSETNFKLRWNEGHVEKLTNEFNLENKSNIVWWSSLIYVTATY